MCGIAGYSLSPNVRINSKRIAREMLLAIEHRGHDATGFAFRDATGQFQVHKQDITASMFVKRRLCVPKDERTVIMHTRWATQGDPSWNANNHPIATGTVVGVHNGHVSNDDALFEAINRVVGRDVRIAEVDSEAAFAVLGHVDGEVTAALEEIRGGAALAWLDRANEENLLHLARLNGSPLIITRTTDGSLFFASTERACLDGIKAAGLWAQEMIDVNEGEYFSVRNGEVVNVESFTPKRYTYNTAYDYGRAAPYGTSTYWDSDEYEWQNGRLIRHNDLHEQVEAHKAASSPGTLGSVVNVTPIRHDDDEIDEDDRDALDQWLYENRNYIAEYEKVAAERAAHADDMDDETAEMIKDLKAKVRWSRMPTLSTGLFDNEYVIRTPGATELLGDVRNFNRACVIEEFSKSMSATAQQQSADLLKVHARPGDAVKCKLEDREYVGHIALLPETFPHGEYTLRLFALNDKRKNKHECFIVQKPYWEFDVIGPGSMLETPADMSEALNRA